MKKLISFIFLAVLVMNVEAQSKPSMLQDDAFWSWVKSTLEKNSNYPERSKYEVTDLAQAKMSINLWGMADSRFYRFRCSGTVSDIRQGDGVFALTLTSYKLDGNDFKSISSLDKNNSFEQVFFGKESASFSGIEEGDFVNVYANFVFERINQASFGMMYFVEMVDILDKPNAQKWQYNGVEYTKTTLQEALRITRNGGKSGKKYNFWSRDIDYNFAVGYFLLKTGTTELALVEYYGEDLSSRNGHGGVLYNIDCTGATPKVTAIKFFEYPSQR